MRPSARRARRLLAALAWATAVGAGAVGEAGAEVQESCPQAAGADAVDELGFVQVTKLVELGIRRITGAGKSATLELAKAPAAHSPALNRSAVTLAALNATANSTAAAGAREAAWPAGYGSILSLLEVKASSSDAAMYVIIGLVIFCIIVGLAVVARESASPPRYLEGRERQQRAPQSGARDLRSQTVLARPGIQPSRTSLIQRTMGQTPASRASVGQQLFLCDQVTLAAFEGLCFSLRPEKLPADAGATGDFEVLCGGTSAAPVLRCSVQLGGSGQRELVLRWCSSRTGAPSPLTSCAPSAMREPCDELQICDADGAKWGTLLHAGGDRYVVKHQGAQVLTLQGDQDEGRLVVYMGAEPVAHAAQSADGNALEVGARARIDPILMLTCVLGVVIFNPTADATPTQTLSQRSQLPGEAVPHGAKPW